LQTAQGKESGGTSRLHEQMGYGYDAGGNLHYRTNNTVAAEPLVQTFSVDNVNQLTSVSRTGKLTVAGGTSSGATNVTVNGQAANRYTDNTFAKEGFTLSGGADTFTAVAQDAYGRGDTNAVAVTMPASASFIYDDNGNLTSDGLRGFGYDAENQLVQVTVTNNWRSEFTYDGFGRRRVRTEYVWQNSAWVVQAVVRYVYDGLLVMQERDGNNVPLVTYTRGRDLSGGRQRAGGIGGLLARTDNATLTSGASRAHAYYHADGNGNVTMLATDKSTVAASYLYDPFGNLLAKAGPLADANLYRFSSKEAHPASGLYYYGFRFYEPKFQRWLNRDPKEEAGGLDLFSFAANNAVNVLDAWGLVIRCKGEDKDLFEFALQCMRSQLPQDSKLTQIINALDADKRTYVVCNMTQRMRESNARPRTTSRNWVFKRDPPTVTYIDPHPYKIGGRRLTFFESLAHELLHAYDWLKDNPRRVLDEGDGPGHDWSFWLEEGELIKELQSSGVDDG
jgi:RHS repeat-associated protein